MVPRLTMTFSITLELTLGEMLPLHGLLVHRFIPPSEDDLVIWFHHEPTAGQPLNLSNTLVDDFEYLKALAWPIQSLRAAGMAAVDS